MRILHSHATDSLKQVENGIQGGRAAPLYFPSLERTVPMFTVQFLTDKLQGRRSDSQAKRFLRLHTKAKKMFVIERLLERLLKCRAQK